MINYADRDVQHLREHTTMLESENRFLESEFQRQLKKIVEEKNKQINQLVHIIDQTCSTSSQHQDRKHPSGNSTLCILKMNLLIIKNKLIDIENYFHSSSLFLY